MDKTRKESEELDQELGELLRRVEGALEVPMIVLALAWLGLLVAELIWGLSPLLERVGTAIWIAFLVDFLIRFGVAPRKGQYLRSNWLTLVSLVLPALRAFRVVRLFRAARAARGLSLVKVVGSLNRGMRALGATMHRRGASYVFSLSLAVLFVGAAGMYAFERNVPGGGGLDSYGDAVWWTAMLLTTVGSEYWPRTPEGRILCLLLSLYGIAILGYVTAVLATFFIGREAESEQGEVAGERSVEAIRVELEALHETVRRLADSQEKPG